MTKKALALWVAGIAAGAALLVPVFRSFDYAGAWEAAVRLPWYAVPGFAGLTLAGFVLTAWRWRLFLPQPPHAWLTPFTLHAIAGYAMSYVTPAALLGGEPAKISLLRHCHGVGLRAASTAVLMDKFVELATVLAFIVVAAVLASAKGLLNGEERAILFPLLAVSILIFLVVYWSYSRSRPFVAKAAGWLFSRRLPRAVERLERLEAEIMAYFSHHHGVLVRSFLVGVSVWAVKYLEIALLLQWFGVEPTLRQAFVVAFVPMLTWLLPIPAGLGAMENVTLALFSFFGWNPATAVAYLIVSRGRDLFMVALGAVHGLRSGLALQLTKTTPDTGAPSRVRE